MKVTVKKETGLQKLTNVFSDMFSSDTKSIVELFPYKTIAEDGLIKDKQDKYQRVLKIGVSDLESLEQEELNKYIGKFSYCLRIMMGSIKILNISTPTPIEKNVEYWDELIKDTRTEISQLDPESPFYQSEIHSLERTLEMQTEAYGRLLFISTLSEMNFRLILYSDSIKEIEQKTDMLIRAGGKELGFVKASKEEVEQMAYKLNNMNDLENNLNLD